MAASISQQAPDRTNEERPADTDKMKEQPLSATNESSISPNSSQGTVSAVHTRETAPPSGSFGPVGDHSVYSPNIYAPQAQTYYFRGYDNVPGEWDEYPPYVSAEGLEIGSPGTYNDNPSLVYHTGYGYSPQIPYGPYSPVTTPSVGGDVHLYSPHQFPFSGPPYYQQMVPPSMPYITSPTPVSQPELTTLMNAEQQNDNMLFGPRSGYPSPLGSFGRGSIPGNPGTIGFHEVQQGFDGLRSGGLWSDWSKPSDRQRPLTPRSPVVSPQPQPIGMFGSFGKNVAMASQQRRSLYGFGSGANSYNRGFMNNASNHGSNFGGASISNLGMNNQGWISIDTSKRRGRGSDSLCGCNGTLDILNEQNRGPRASKPKSQMTEEHGSSAENNKQSMSAVKILDESYNQADFVTDYKDAKFFIIKSYSEDNVHKSIKYGVWASTPNGNKKLDVAYHEAKEKQDAYPVFLFFSVNASAQFCGVAEMIGPVDFEKSVDYWQQDKWSGQFPVKWHIIKDVPNSQFRHIVLENNDNKPVTNSRDTQEVKLEQGIEMLSIFKNYETDVSILDDFDFYEDRQKAIQERKARQQASLMAVGVVGEKDHKDAVPYSTDFIKQVSKSFAQVVRLDEGNKDGPGADRATSASDASMGARVKLEDALAAAISSAQSS